MKPDLVYYVGPLFTTFYPETEAGIAVWNELADATDGTGKILSIHKESTIQQLQAAGYTVSKGKDVVNNIDEILDEYDNLQTNDR